MSITFKWSVQKVQVSEGNLVKKVDLSVTATDQDNNLAASAAYIRELVRSDTFIEFNQLTEKQVLDWCLVPGAVTWTDIDGNEQSVIKNLKDEGETQVAEQIKRQLAQKAAEPALPWVKIPA